MPATDHKLIFLVIGSIAGLATVYVLTMAACIVFGINPDASAGQAFNHVGDILVGALIGVLAKTAVATDKPTPTTIVNPPENPVQTTDVHDAQ